MPDEPKKTKPKVVLYTDGACSQNPGPGGWAYVLKHPASGREKEASGSEHGTTNNRMEMLAVIRGLEALKAPSSVDIYSDSEYVVKGIMDRMGAYRAFGWCQSATSKKVIKNADLWRQLYALSRVNDLTAHWIRGHVGHPDNERCDRLAEAAAISIRNSDPSRVPPS